MPKRQRFQCSLGKSSKVCSWFCLITHTRRQFEYMRLRLTCFIAVTETISAERQCAYMCRQTQGIVDGCSMSGSPKLPRLITMLDDRIVKNRNKSIFFFCFFYLSRARKCFNSDQLTRSLSGGGRQASTPHIQSCVSSAQTSTNTTIKI
jgi:hypothetical protein